jgi:DNA-binding transcriptional MerR regulator
MLSIGEFARLGGVSVRALRHDEGVGLLEPVPGD